MASLAQIEANRRNALMSTGPTSPDGKVSSSRNSRRHGLTAEATDGAELYPGFEARLAAWEAEIRPQTVRARFALRRAVAATFRMEACESAYSGAIADHRRRAEESWDDDRGAEAAALLARLAKKPELASAYLRKSAQGVRLMLMLWGRLGESLDANRTWDDAEVSTACDLIGIPTDLRRGRLPFDPHEPGADPYQSRRDFVRAECAGLAKALERLSRLDASDRERAREGSIAILSAPCRLIHRYESASWRWFHKMLAVAKSSEPGEPGEDLQPRNEPLPRLESPPLPPLPVIGPPPVRVEPLVAMPAEAPRDYAAIARELTATPPASFEELKSRMALAETCLAELRTARGADPVVTDEELTAALADPDLPPPAPSPSGLNRHQRRAREALARSSR